MVTLTHVFILLMFDILAFIFSGQKTENSLLLFWQYNDEEMEEHLGKEISHGTGQSPIELDK